MIAHILALLADLDPAPDTDWKPYAIALIVAATYALVEWRKKLHLDNIEREAALARQTTAKTAEKVESLSGSLQDNTTLTAQIADDLATTKDHINSKMDAALAAQKELGHAEGTAEEKQRQADAARPTDKEGGG